MSQAAIERVADAQRALAHALDQGSAADIQAATETLARAVQALGGTGGWHVTPELRVQLRRALAAGEAARIRTRYLAEHGRTRLERVQALTGRGSQVGYGRNGQYRAA